MQTSVEKNAKAAVADPTGRNHWRQCSCRQSTPAEIEPSGAFSLRCTSFLIDYNALNHSSQSGRSIPPEGKGYPTQTTLDNNRDEVRRTLLPTSLTMQILQFTCRARRPYDTIAPIRSPKIRYAESMCDECRFNVPFPIEIVTLVRAICHVDMNSPLFLFVFFFSHAHSVASS